MVKNHIKIIMALLEQGNESISIYRLSKLVKLDYKNVYTSVMDLEKKGLLDINSFGNSKQIKLKRIVHPYIFEAEFERRKNLFRNKDFLVISNTLASLNFLFIVLLFGSYAKRESRKGSDIDLLIICDKNKEAEINNKLDLFPLKIHASFVDFGEFISMAKLKEFNVVNEAIKNNFILVGIEDYYRLLENVG